MNIDTYYTLGRSGLRISRLALDDQVRAGKIRYIGLSDVPAWYAARMQTLAEWRGLEPVQLL